MNDDRDRTGSPPSEEEKKRIAREGMLARQRLIQAIIDNNERQLRFDNQFGGADIERARIVREISKTPDDPALAQQLAESDRVIGELNEIHRRLVAEREWLNQSLHEFDDRPENKGRLE